MWRQCFIPSKNGVPITKNWLFFLLNASHTWLINVQYLKIYLHELTTSSEQKFMLALFNSAWLSKMLEATNLIWFVEWTMECVVYEVNFFNQLIEPDWLLSNNNGYTALIWICIGRLKFILKLQHTFWAYYVLWVSLDPKQ